jgi:hypothetical protein
MKRTVRITSKVRVKSTRRRTLSSRLSWLPASIEDAAKLDIYTQEQAWKFIGTKLRVKRFGPWAGANAKKRPVEDEVRELLASTILPNVAVSILLYNNEEFARICLDLTIIQKFLGIFNSILRLDTRQVLHSSCVCFLSGGRV